MANGQNLIMSEVREVEYFCPGINDRDKVSTHLGKREGYHQIKEERNTDKSLLCLSREKKGGNNAFRVSFRIGSK